MKLERLRLTNFMIHKALNIEFSPNITVIIGDNNTGKSAIFRALKALAHNKPTNPEKVFLTHKEKNQIIELTTTDHVISKEDKEYTIIDRRTKHKEVLKAFKTEVPVQVQNAINLKPINWQFQLDQHFLVLENGGSAAKILNKIFGNEDLEKITHTVKEKISNGKSDLKQNIKNKTDKEVELEKLTNIDEYKKEMEVINNMMQELKENYTEQDIIFNALNKIESIDKDIKYLATLGVLSQDLEELLQTNDDLKTIKKEVIELEGISIRINGFEKTNNIPTNELIKSATELTDLKKDIDIIKDNQIRVKQIYTNITTSNENIYEEEIKQLQADLQTLFSDLGFCPTCERKF